MMYDYIWRFSCITVLHVHNGFCDDVSIFEAYLGCDAVTAALLATLDTSDPPYTSCPCPTFPGEMHMIIFHIMNVKNIIFNVH